MTSMIGEKLKQLRQSKKLTLKELSDKSNLSIGFLSKIERGISTISVESLAVIAQCLDTNVNYFFDEMKTFKNDTIVVRSYQRNLLYSESQKRINFLLTNNVENKMFLPKLVELLPGFNEELNSSNHEGQEFIYVLEGAFTIFVKKSRDDLYPGDSIFFDSRDDHIWVNYTNKVTKLIVITVPNLFR